MICCGILKNQELISDFEWNFFLRGSMGVAYTGALAKPPLRWLSDQMWKNCCDLATNIPQFGYILEHISIYSSEWELIIESDTPFSDLIPGDTTGQLPDFLKLLLLKILREEKLATCMSEFVRKHLGAEFVMAPPLDLVSFLSHHNYSGKSLQGHYKPYSPGFRSLSWVRSDIITSQICINQGNEHAGKDEPDFSWSRTGAYRRRAYSKSYGQWRMGIPSKLPSCGVLDVSTGDYS